MREYWRLINGSSHILQYIYLYFQPNLLEILFSPYFGNLYFHFYLFLLFNWLLFDFSTFFCVFFGLLFLLFFLLLLFFFGLRLLRRFRLHIFLIIKEIQRNLCSDEVPIQCKHRNRIISWNENLNFWAFLYLLNKLTNILNPIIRDIQASQSWAFFDYFGQYLIIDLVVT